MKIAVISDSHDRIENVKKVIEICKEEGVAELIHCGDFTAPFMIDELEKFVGEVHIVFGNIDDRYRTTKKVNNSENVNLYGNHFEMEIQGKKIGAVHSPEIAKFMAKSQEFDVVFYGHTHNKNEEKIGKTLLINPGELMGRKEKPGFVIYDVKEDKVEFKELK